MRKVGYHELHHRCSCTVIFETLGLKRLLSIQDFYGREKKYLEFKFVAKKLNSIFYENDDDELHICREMMSPALETVQCQFLC